MTECIVCKKDLTKTKHTNLCSLVCAKHHYNRKRLERHCKCCGKIEYVANKTQMERMCRSCSKLGNTSSASRSKQTCKKISEARKGKAPWNKGKKDIYSAATKKSMGAKNIDKKATKETKKKLSESLKKFYEDKKGPNTGRLMSDAQKLKISDSLALVDRAKYKESDIAKKAEEEGLKLIAVPEGNLSQIKKITLKCICGNNYEAKIQNFMDFEQHKRCQTCNNKGDSAQERELYSLVKSTINDESVAIEKGTKPSFMQYSNSRYQLDIYVPIKKVAIEYHGLAFHSERPVFSPKSSKDISNIKKKHELKYELCKKEGVQLIQIFEDEWKANPEIIKSMIKSRLGISSTRIYARKCEIREIQPKVRRSFLESTHISGDVASKVAFGLFYEGVLVSAVSLRGTWNKAYGDRVIEIARFASALDTQVVGGFSKLLKRCKKWSKEQGYETILTYADCRFGQGLVYAKSGFKYEGKTKPNYFYEKGGKREARFKHRKSSSLEGATEREQQNKLGWYAIYDAGNNIYTMEL